MRNSQSMQIRHIEEFNSVSYGILGCMLWILVTQINSYKATRELSTYIDKVPNDNQKQAGKEWGLSTGDQHPLKPNKTDKRMDRWQHSQDEENIISTIQDRYLHNTTNSTEYAEFRLAEKQMMMSVPCFAVHQTSNTLGLMAYKFFLMYIYLYMCV